MNDPNADFVNAVVDTNKANQTNESEHPGLAPFQPGDFVQDLVDSPNEILRIDAVRASRHLAPDEGDWKYDVTVVVGAGLHDWFRNVPLSENRFRKVSSPAIPDLTLQQREIYDAAVLLLHRLERNVPDDAVHWLNESLKTDLERLTNQDNVSSKVYARRTAFVGNWPTADYRKDADGSPLDDLVQAGLVPECGNIYCPCHRVHNPDKKEN